MRAVAFAVLLASGSASAATIHGLVYDDANGDHQPSVGERGIANAVVALDVQTFVVTDAAGQFDIRIPDGQSGIVWVRVPDGFVPGPVWAKWSGKGDVDLGLHRLAAPIRGPLTFVVAADTHLASSQDYFGANDLANAALEATALDPAPAFFTILGDMTQGNQDAEFDLIDRALAGLGVPWVPVPGNHDWYDDGETWFRRYGPDNYSFDIGQVHFVVWNMSLGDDAIRAYLGAELAHVDRAMTIVALTHAPPAPSVVPVLRNLGVAYVLTGHAHSNRPVDHDGVIELNTEPMLMGGLDFTPAGYRVVTIDGGRLTSYHRTVVEAPVLSVVAPARGQCTQRGAELLVAAELDAGASIVTARIDCASPIVLRWVGGWSWRAALPALDPGPHAIEIEATSAAGARASATTAIEICDPEPVPAAGPDWSQLGGGPAHLGARAQELAPPLATRWTAAIGGHVLAAAPAIAGGSVYVAVTDLGDGGAGGIVALELATGAVRWRAPTPKPVRGGVAVTGTTVIAAQIDGVVLGLDAASGAVRWRHELSVGVAPQAGAVFAPPTVEGGDVVIGHQRALAAIAGETGTPLWTADPVPEGLDSQTLAAVAVNAGLVIGTFNRAIGGIAAWDRATGVEQWRLEGYGTIAVNAAPVIAGDTVFVASGTDEVTAIDLGGQVRWRSELDPAGFAWGNATVGTPAYAHGILVVPTLYRDLVALDAITGVELWRHAGTPSPLRTTHYRGAAEAGFEASPVITGDLVWAADTAGVVVALDLHTGDVLWRSELGVPVLAGLAASGDWLVVASYDGTVRALARAGSERTAAVATTCSAVEPGGCCEASDAPGGVTLLVLIAGAAIARRRR